ncbi:MAG: ATP-grasp domain-containing protein [Streptosporangiaceae bacterium]
MTSAAAPSLLMLGAEPYLIKACVELGVDLVVAYGPAVRDADALHAPDQVRTVFVQDQRSPEAVLSALARAGLAGGPAGHGFDAVLTVYEHSLVHAAVLAQLYGCRGLTPDVAVRFRDKWLQKEAIRVAGLPTARSTVIEDIAYPGELPELDTWPRVLKPMYGVGTQLTAVVSSQAELRAAAASFYRRQPRNRVYVAEEFSHGDEWTADGVVVGGDLRFLSVATYGEPCLTSLRNQAPMIRIRFDPEADSGAFRAAEPFVRRCIAALGLADGVFHLELFRAPDSGSLIFGECAARQGAALVPEEVRYKFGIDLGEEAVRCALGLTPRLDVKVSPDVIGNTYLLGPPGVVLSCPSPAEVLAREGMRFVTIERPAGSVIPDSLTDMNVRAGMAVLAAPTPGELDRRMAGLRTWFASRLVVVPLDATERTVRAVHRRAWPDADLDDADYTQARLGQVASGPSRAGGQG